MLDGSGCREEEEEDESGYVLTHAPSAPDLSTLDTPLVPLSNGHLQVPGSSILPTAAAG